MTHLQDVTGDGGGAFVIGRAPRQREGGGVPGTQGGRLGRPRQVPGVGRGRGAGGGRTVRGHHLQVATDGGGARLRRGAAHVLPAVFLPHVWWGQTDAGVSDVFY